MDRCALAYEYHRQGYNCAQSVAGAFSDLTNWTPEQLFSAAGGFGGGYGGSHEEACGAISGALLVLGILFPHTGEGDLEAKRAIYGLAKTFRQRFLDVFGRISVPPLTVGKSDGIAGASVSNAEYGI